MKFYVKVSCLLHVFTAHCVGKFLHGTGPEVLRNIKISLPS